MNISQVEFILKNLGDDASDFIEALSDADHYLGVAIELLSAHDRVTLRELVGAAEIVSEVLGLAESEVDDDDDDNDPDKVLQEAYDIIAADDDDADEDYTPGQIEALLIAEFTRGVA